MRKLVLFFSLLFLISACGDKAPEDAVVTGPTNSTTPVLSAEPVIYNALDFKVSNAAGDALPDVEIQFFAGGPGGVTLIDLNGAILGTGIIYTTTTNARGIARVSFRLPIAACPATTDTITVGSVRGTVGNADAIWTTRVTLKCS